MSTASVVWFTTAGTAPSCPLGARPAWLVGLPRPGSSDYGEKDKGCAVLGLPDCPHRTPTHQPTALQVHRELRKVVFSVCINLDSPLPPTGECFGTECTEGRVGLNPIFTSLALLNLRLGLACRGKHSHLQTIRPLNATRLPIIGALGRVILPGQMAPHLSSWGIISQPVVHTPPGGFLSSTHMY